MTSDVEAAAGLAGAIQAYGARVRSDLGLETAGPVSYAGLWLLLARLGSVVADEEEFRRTFGLDPKAAQDAAARLFDEPHPTVAAALGAWLADGVELSGELPVTLDPLPSQAELDAWAGKHTRDLIDTFPIQVDPLTMLVLASALVLTPRWSHGVEIEESDGVDLVVSDGVQAVVKTSVGPVAVVIPPTYDQVDVVSVIAAPDVAPRDVWRAVDEVVVALNAGTLANGAFPDGMADEEVARGHAWTVRDIDRTFYGRSPQEGAFVWESRVPQWSDTTRHELTDAPGVALVTAPIRALLPMESEVECVQSATASYDDEGFSAASVTAIAMRMSSARMPQVRRVRQVSVDFHRPHALVAIARGGHWEGIPLVHAWVTPD